MDTTTVTKICNLMYGASLNCLDDLDDANGANAFVDEMHEVSGLLKNFPTTYTDSSLRIERHISRFDSWDVYWSIDTMSAHAQFTETPKMSLVSFRVYNESHPAIKAKPLPSDSLNTPYELQVLLDSLKHRFSYEYEVYFIAEEVYPVIKKVGKVATKNLIITCEDDCWSLYYQDDFGVIQLLFDDDGNLETIDQIPYQYEETIKEILSHFEEKQNG